MDTLTIIAQEQYNGTVVVCVATFDDGRPNEESIPATLTGMYDVTLSWPLFTKFHQNEQVHNHDKRGTIIYV
jgi:predicted pyridoxine 5'-phosphate oxidase superfamily flavin-nucleotide-binding protein